MCKEDNPLTIVSNFWTIVDRSGFKKNNAYDCSDNTE